MPVERRGSRCPPAPPNAVRLLRLVSGPVLATVLLLAGCRPSAGGKSADSGSRCDEGSAPLNPGATESCATQADDDCDGLTNEEGATGCTTFYADADGDGYGDTRASACLCSATSDYPGTTAGDCDDADASVHVDAREICNDLDDDCDGVADDGLPTYTWYTDGDSDGYGDAATETTGCVMPRAVVTNGQDCDDGDADVHPGAPEVCDDGVDDNCDGVGCIESTPLSSGCEYTGEAPSAYTGWAVAGAGDVDADGYDDVLIGGSSSAAWLVLGSASPVSANLSSALEYTGEAPSDYGGWSVAGAGDVNADGYADLLVGAYGDDAAASDAGAAWLVLGGEAPASASLSSGTGYFGEASLDRAGYSVGSAGDVNGDGYADILVGAAGNSDAAKNAGAAYLVLGSASAASSSLSSAFEYSGEAEQDAAGWAVADADDVDGDGYADILVGAAGYGDGADEGTGAAYLVLGSASPASASLSAAYAYTGEAPFDYAGSSVAGAGDVNGDGYADVLVGGPGADEGGAAWLVLGGPSPGSTSLASAYEYTGESSDDDAGRAVSGAGDVDGDGYADLLIGDHLNNDGATCAGAAFLVPGSASPASANLTSAYQYQGGRPYSYAGAAVAGAGDVDGDGYSDFLVGAFGTNDAFLVLAAGL